MAKIRYDWDISYENNQGIRVGFAYCTTEKQVLDVLHYLITLEKAEKIFVKRQEIPEEFK